MRLCTVILALTALLLVGCGKKTEAPAADKAPAAEKVAEKAAAAPEAATATAGATDKAVAAPKGVTLTAAGTNFDPPIAKDKVPKGAWYCDMGTVHYARLDKADGKCPRCQMDLKHNE